MNELVHEKYQRQVREYQDGDTIRPAFYNEQGQRVHQKTFTGIERVQVVEEISEWFDWAFDAPANPTPLQD